MTARAIEVTFWGVRGSLPVSGPQFAGFGGSTICFQITCGETVLLFDAGSGILPAGQALRSAGARQVHLMFTHCHYDHILGFPYFAPLFDPACTVDIWSGHLAGLSTTEAMLRDFMRPPWFPVKPDICPASIRCHDFRAGDRWAPVPGVALRTGPLAHPGGAVGYRIDWQGRSVAVITDTEHEPGTLDPHVLALIEGVDLFLYDGSYTDAEMARFRGFGHSSWQQAIRLAEAAGAKRVALVHHAPFRTDAELKAIEAEAGAAFAGLFVARENQMVLV